MNPQAVQFLVVRIRRENVLEDALNTIAVASPDELKKPLRIIFSSGEPGTGGEGCQKHHRISFSPRQKP